MSSATVELVRDFFEEALIVYLLLERVSEVIDGFKLSSFAPDDS